MVMLFQVTMLLCQIKSQRFSIYNLGAIVGAIAEIYVRKMAFYRNAKLSYKAT